MANKNDKNNGNLENWRKFVYIVGNISILVGIILFLTSFISNLNNDPLMGDLSPFESFKKPLIGIILIGLGGFLRSLGRGGISGSGLILDPEGKRRDERAFSKAKGKEYSDIYESFKDESNIKDRIMVRCPKCKTLNDEDSTFCKSCGNKLI